ncbi:MAG: NrtA/SsuA/CpmA family ABC transporter substrate-binding protein [Candidatus Tectomicrobia bacterium]|uniref:NrtA/SsuA/CpmA family ABC transporter substrate-binding protein n=1 Tax=Tectimicrobiota bacterium TaxID=2528274 RepID=A0A933GMM8_UNCTE|nr:NrtA/SsuA/CpmA family ABC transporter substrate-binding protein [Candidatus Tectomicrobia bacterium]
MNKKNIFVILGVLIVILGAAFVLWFRTPKGYSGKVESITIGTPPLESSALIYIAEERHFFTDKGLSVTIRGYDTGVSAFNGLLKGEVDIAVPAEYPLIVAAFKREKVRAIASIDKVSYFYLIGRKDRGIKDISNLKGKKIGVVRKTIAEFYLGRFLDLNGINIGQVTLIDVSPSRSEDAIIRGDVDAIISRPPYIRPIEERLGVNAVIWPAQSGQALYAILIGRNDWITGHPEPIKRLLSSLAQAEEYIIHHSAETKAILQKKLNLTDHDVTKVWSENQFSLSLDQSFILAMEDEARWMIKNNLPMERTVPDFTNYIYIEGLKTLKPEAVDIIR